MRENGKNIKSNLVFFGIGTKPNTKLANDCGIKIGENGDF